MAQLYEMEASFLDSKSVFTNPETNKTYFKAFLLNGFFNKRKFKIGNRKALHTDIDGFENMPVTLVEEGFRKGNHPSPKDANIFEANYSNKYTYVTEAVNYYRKFEVAKIVKIYKPDLNLLTASGLEERLSSIDPNNYYALCETTNQKMITMLNEADTLNKKIYVSPAMFSWDWVKDPETGEVSVNSFVPTHLAIVDKPAYDPEVAYIRKQICKKDGMTCYYELFESSELENLNNDTQQKNNMSTPPAQSTKPFTDLESYLKSQYSLDVQDLQNIPAEEVVKGLKDLSINYKNKVSNNNSPPANNNGNVPITQFTEKQQEETKTELKTEKPKEEKKEQKSNPNFTLEDVQKLLVEQEERILNKFKEKETKAERENILGSYLENDKIKSVKDKIDTEKLNKVRELYNGLPLNNTQLRTILENSIYNPNFATQDIYKSALALSEVNREINQKEIKTQVVTDPIKQQSTKTVEEINKLSGTPITDIPPKQLPNINGYGTEFKSSSDSGNKYNDNFKSKTFEASNSGRESKPVPTTGEGIPKRFQKYIN
jgi:hypothetical protein